MKYCLSARQSKQTLAKADEIKIFWADRDILNDYIEENISQTIILEVSEEDPNNIDWSLLSMFNEKFNFNFYLCLKDLILVDSCKQYNIKFYWYYPVSTYYELNQLQKLGVSQIFVNPPLSFNLKKIKEKTGLLIRAFPNKAYDNYIPRENGICGFWIRPEDIAIYEDCIDTIEFWAKNITTEETLFHIYAENKNWPGNLNLLIKNLNINIDNRAFPDNFGEIRKNCHQRCQENQACHFCETVFNFISTLEKKHKEEKSIEEKA